jgi:hypothetical protein
MFCVSINGLVSAAESYGVSREVRTEYHNVSNKLSL